MTLGHDKTPDQMAANVRSSGNREWPERSLAFEFKTKMKMKEKHGHRLHLNFLENKHTQENKYENYFKSSTRRTTKLTCCANLEINNMPFARGGHLPNMLPKVGALRAR